MGFNPSFAVFFDFFFCSRSEGECKKSPDQSLKTKIWTLWESRYPGKDLPDLDVEPDIEVHPEAERVLQPAPPDDEEILPFLPCVTLQQCNAYSCCYAILCHCLSRLAVVRQVPRTSAPGCKATFVLSSSHLEKSQFGSGSDFVHSHAAISVVRLRLDACN